jgi:hypothetical protein
MTLDLLCSFGRPSSPTAVLQLFFFLLEAIQRGFQHSPPALLHGVRLEVRRGSSRAPAKDVRGQCGILERFGLVHVARLQSVGPLRGSALEFGHFPIEQRIELFKLDTRCKSQINTC